MHSSESSIEREPGLTSGLRRRGGLLSFIVVIGSSAFLAAQGAGSASVAPLKLMPLPRSVEMGTGRLVVDAHFKAAIAGDHDARLNAALDRMITRLDRQCGEIRRSQYGPGVTAPPVLNLKVAGPGGAVQGVDEDESYQLKITPAQATLTAATDVGAMHGMETFLQLVSIASVLTMHRASAGVDS